MSNENTRAILEFSIGNSSSYLFKVIESDKVIKAKDYTICLKGTNKKFLRAGVDHFSCGSHGRESRRDLNIQNNMRLT